MKVLWCWRCRMDVPMLEPDEARAVWAMQFRGLETFDWSSLDGIYDELGDRHLVDERLVFEHESGGMLREYERITGFTRHTLWPCIITRPHCTALLAVGAGSRSGLHRRSCAGGA